MLDKELEYFGWGEKGTGPTNMVRSTRGVRDPRICPDVNVSPFPTSQRVYFIMDVIPRVHPLQNQ